MSGTPASNPGMGRTQAGAWVDSSGAPIPAFPRARGKGHDFESPP